MIVSAPLGLISCWFKLNQSNLFIGYSFISTNVFKKISVTLDFSSLLKNHFECSFVSSECSLQSSNVPMFVLKFVPTIYDEPALQVLIGCIISQLIKLLTVQSS